MIVGARAAARRVACAVACVIVSSAVDASAPAALHAQERGAAALAQAVDGLGVTTRVLVVAAHPDDEDTQLIAWLARSQRVHTAYLSLTRGDGGQNLIGNELGEGLGVIRTEELLAARRVDGGHQFFTRAYDFGFSKSAEETFRHWPREEILGDVVKVVRAFRPHVIVSVFSGTPRDGHGHHQVAGILAGEAYAVAADTVRFPRREFGVPWQPLKLYRGSRFDRANATLEIPVGDYDPVLGRSFAEIAGESRSQHKSQGFGALERRGPVSTFLRREQSRAPAPEDPRQERSLFDGIDTTWSRFAPVQSARARSALDAMPGAIAAVRHAFDMRNPERMVAPLLTLIQHLVSVCVPDVSRQASACSRMETTANGQGARLVTTNPDLEATVESAFARAQEALALAVGVALEAEAPVEVVPAGDHVPVIVRFFNRGRDTVTVLGAAVPQDSDMREVSRLLPPGAVWVDTLAFAGDSVTTPWWLEQPRHGAMFADLSTRSEDRHAAGAAQAAVSYRVRDASGAGTMILTAPVVRRFADPVRGDVSRPIAVVPRIAVTLDRAVELVEAGRPIERAIAVRLRSAAREPVQATVRLVLPASLTADSAARTVTLDGYDAQAAATFLVRGQLRPGRDSVRVVVESGGEQFTTGYELIDYEHIRPQRLYRPAVLALEAVEVRLPPSLRVGYIAGVGDNVAPALRQLGVDVTMVEPAALATADLSRFTTLVVGPRAYEAHPQVMANRGRLLDFARAGGTLVVQYQQFELMQPGVAPYPLAINRPHDRVTEEDAPVTVRNPASPLLTTPNRIGVTDFDGWVQERSLYMPRTFDERYAAPLELADPGEPPRQGAILVAPLGRGTYVYTSLSFFRQLPAGVPGAARLFVNLLSAGQTAGATTSPGQDE